jgi:pimeloyl-ACP methyl ester carboxylesterase
MIGKGVSIDMNDPPEKTVEATMYYDELIQIPINGLQQWISIRGMKKENPILLFLHGGPGFPGIAVSTAYQQRLEDRFTVVQWDQRGAGKTYLSSGEKQPLTISLYLSDLFQLLDYIADRFDKEKVYLIGHSWGSLLGMLAVKQAPHRLISYIGVGQFVNLRQNSELCYQYCCQKAKENGDNALIDAVKKLDVADNCTAWDAEHQFAALFGGALYGKTDLMPVAELFFKSALYTEEEKQSIPKAMVESCVQLYGEMSKHDLANEIKSIDVPVMFLSGKHDHFSVTELVREYFTILHAPNKSLVLFDESAHFPFLEETEYFTSKVCEWFER